MPCCTSWWESVSQFLDTSCSTCPTKFQTVLLLLVSKPSSSGQNKPYALGNRRAMVWCKSSPCIFQRRVGSPLENIRGDLCSSPVPQPGHPLHGTSHSWSVPARSMFAANAKNDISVLQNLSAVSVGNDLDFFPADSDILEEITICTSQRFTRQRRKSLCCKPALFCFSLPDKGTDLFVLITRMKGACGFCL